MAANYNEYNEAKKGFFTKHNNDFYIETSSMDQYGTYHKEYIFDDNSVWYEVMSRVSEEVELKGTSSITGLEVSEKVVREYLRTEFWSTDNSKSAYYYEKF